MTQYSLFGAEASTPTLGDLDGLLLAGAQWVRSGSGARLSVVVADEWRAVALAAAFAELGLGLGLGPGTGTGDPVVPAASGHGVRTAFSADLLPYAARWTRGANQGLPADLALGAQGLRLWAVAGGHRDDVGYLLATPDPDERLHRAAGAQLARLGVAAVFLSQRGGPGWRVSSARRLRRLVELVGPAPAGCGNDWPPVSSR